MANCLAGWWTARTADAELSRILNMPETHSTGREQQLERLAQRLACSVQGLRDPVSTRFDEKEAVLRIREAARSWRESSQWMFAVISAITSMLSAAAAWSAVLRKQ